MKKVLLQSMLASQEEILSEANIANSGNTGFTIELSDSDDYIKVNPFDVIYEKFLVSIKNKTSRSKPVQEWMNRQFKKWVLNGFQDYPEFGQYPTKERLEHKLFPDLNEFIDEVMADDPSIAEDDIRKHLPDFIKKNPEGATIFANGKKFGFKYLGRQWDTMMEEMIDYLVAVVNEKGNTDIIPNQLHIKDIGRLGVVDAIENAHTWHVYTERNASKIDDAQAKKMMKDLKEGTDYEVLHKFKSGGKMVKALKGTYTTAEGSIMKHCVASYGGDVDSGRMTIYSYWNKSGLPEATIEISNGNIHQVKGKHNGPVKEDYHSDIVDFILENELSWGSTVDQSKVNWKKVSQERIEALKAEKKPKGKEKPTDDVEDENPDLAAESLIKEITRTKTDTKTSFNRSNFLQALETAAQKAKRG